MPRVTEKPLTTAAFQRFFNTLYQAIQHSEIPTDDRSKIKRAIMQATLPVSISETVSGLYAGISTGPGLAKILPETLSELRNRMELLASGKLDPAFGGVAFPQNHSEEFTAMCERALNSASKVMEPGPGPGHVGGK